MAIKAGRHGVNIKDIDPRTGRIKGYELPQASGTKLGGVKVGSNMSISSAGVLTAKAQVPAHTTAEAGKVLTVKADGDLEWQEKGGSGGLAVGDEMSYFISTTGARNSSGVYALIDVVNNRLITDESSTNGFSWTPSQEGSSTKYVRIMLIAGQRIGLAFAFNIAQTIEQATTFRIGVLSGTTNPAAAIPSDLLISHEFVLEPGTYTPGQIIDVLEFNVETAVNAFAVVYAWYDVSDNLWKSLNLLPTASSSKYLLMYPYNPAE